MSERRIVRVGEVMSAAPKSIDGMATVSEAIAIMRNERISSLVINRRYQGDEYGLVMVADIAREIIAKDRSPQRTNVYEIMTKPVLTVDIDMDIKNATRLLTHFNLSRCLVVKDKEIVGIVTLRDMVLQNLETAHS